MDTEKPQDLSTQKVLHRIGERWRELQSILASLRPDDWERPLGDGWPVKVHVAHLADWEDSLLALLRGESRAAAMGITEDVWQQHNTDSVNRILAERALKMTPGQCGARLERSHARMVVALEGMTDAQLRLPYSHYQPLDGAHNAQPVVGWVIGNTYEHFDEHIGWLRAGLTHA